VLEPIGVEVVVVKVRMAVVLGPKVEGMTAVTPMGSGPLASLARPVNGSVPVLIIWTA
jgi:hypothetical protein